MNFTLKSLYRPRAGMAKILLVMKLIVLLLTTAILQVSASSFAQKITIQKKNIALQEVFSEIRKQTGYDVLWQPDKVDVNKTLNLSIKEQSLEQALNQVLAGQSLNYTIKDKTVMIRFTEPSFLDKIKSAFADTDVRGRVVDEQGNPLSGATVMIKGQNRFVKTADQGVFILGNVPDDAVLIISYVGFTSLEVKLKGAKLPLEIQLNQVTGQLEEVAVKGSTGYQVIDKNHPGSFDVIDNNLLNRSVSSNILARIANLTPGLSYGTVNEIGPDNPAGILIRGRNSIFSSVAPLIVLDNFPYDGDVKNINPNDIENVTVLKDAAAAALWGARAGNGVIVITTKRGKSTSPSVEFNSNLTSEGRPRLKNRPVVSSSEAIELEKWLFDKGYYNGKINNTALNAPLTPVQEILLQKRSGTITADQTEALIEPLKNIDIRQDVAKYFYRPSLVQRHLLNVSGNSPAVNYFFSAGWDKNRTNLVGAQDNRISLRSNNSFRISPKLEINFGLTYTQTTNLSGDNSGPGLLASTYPYADLVSSNGTGLTLARNFRNSYTDTVGKGKLLDWKYRPYDEIRFTENSTTLKDYLINTRLQYKIFNSLRAEVHYQYENQTYIGQQDKTIQAYSTRDIVNRFYQPTALNKNPIPIGGILSISNASMFSHQGRAQLNFAQSWKNQHRLEIIGGWEIKEVKSRNNEYMMYGYERNGSKVNPTMDFVTQYPQFNMPSVSNRIPNSQVIGETLDRFISGYGSLLYALKDRYFLSLSAREDAANLLGARTNNRGVPLWSAGFGWDLSKEWFYGIDWMPYLRINASYGRTGSISRAVTGVTTFSLNPVSYNLFGLRSGRVVNPPNESLKWEQNRILNFGIDFASKNQKISGTIQYYRKQNLDLIASAPFDPTSGINFQAGPTIFTGNIASTKGHGIDIQLNSSNSIGAVKWLTNLLFSFNEINVTDYFLPPPVKASDYVNREAQITPIIGQPVYTMYSYRWAGLDPNNGDPQGYVGNNISKKYSEIINNTSIDSLVYSGAVQPPYLGAFRNTFTWKNLSISANITYRLKYYLRKPSINYNASFSSSAAAHSDYMNRWQNPGDEQWTNIPSLVYINSPGFTLRDNFYANSETLLERGDHIKLDDLTVDYVLASKRGNLPFKQVAIYSNISNLGIILWKASKANIDPSNPNGKIMSKQFSVGVKAIF